MELCNFLLITDLPQPLCCWPSSVVGIQFISSDCSAPDNLELSKNCKPDRSNWERQEDAGLQQQDGRSEGGLFYRLHMGGNIVFPLFAASFYVIMRYLFFRSTSPRWINKLLPYSEQRREWDSLLSNAFTNLLPQTRKNNHFASH